jgi:putative two-component system response regulator
VMNGYEFYDQLRARPDWVTIPFLFLTASSEPSDILASRNLGIDDYLTKPIGREELVSVIRSRIDRYHQVQMAQTQQAYQASLTALANAVEARSPESNKHVERVTELALALAKRLEWRERRLVALRFGAILHDVGKIHIPASILAKPGPLDQAEWEEVKRHPITGAEMIKGVPMLGGAGLMVRHHHERWDGKGYPDQLAGKTIPEGGRILAVADAFTVMITPQPYRLAIPLEKAYKEIQELSGKNYDPKVVEAFDQAWKDGEVQAILDK